MLINLTVEFPDDERPDIELTCDARDILAWERAAPDRALGQLLGLSIKQGDLYSLSFAALRRRGLFDGKQSELELTALVNMGHKRNPGSEEVDRSGEDPTQKDHSADER